MALFEQFPYTNFHEMNMDWLLQEVNKLKQFPSIINEGALVVTVNKSDPLNITADKTYDEIKGAIVSSIPVLIREVGGSGFKIPTFCTLNSLTDIRIYLADTLMYDDVDDEYDILYNWYFEFKDDGTITENTDRVAVVTA